MPYEHVSFLSIMGDVIIHSISFEDQATSTDSCVDPEVFDNGVYLFRAAHDGQLSVVNKLLSSGANVNARDYKQATPLLLASMKCHEIVVERLLIVNGIDVNAADVTKSTALHWASINGSLDIVKLLLKYGANINAQNNKGFTPLHIAIGYKHIEISKLLIQNKVNFIITDHLQFNVLHTAICCGSPLSIVQPLIEKGKIVKAAVADGRTALHFAAQFNCYMIAKCLIECGAEVDAQSYNLWTPLHNAAHAGSLSVAEILLENGANTEMKSIVFTPPLYLAVRRNHVEVVKLLLINGATVNNDVDANQSALHVASENGDVNITKLLLKFGANINLGEGTDRSTPLHYAARYSHLTIVKLLIENGAIVNAKTSDLATPLHLAAVNSDVVKLLLKYGSFFDSKTKCGRYPQDRFREDKDASSIFEIIEKLFTAISDHSLTAVKQCLAEGAILDCASEVFESPLLYATKKGNINIVNCLLEGGANANIKNENNFTSLHYACQSQNFEIVCSLLKHGAVYNVTCGDDKKRPIDFASDLDIILLLQVIEDMFINVATTCLRALSKLQLKESQNPKILSALSGALNENFLPLAQIANLEANPVLTKVLFETMQMSTR